MNVCRLRQVRRLFPEHDGPHGPVAPHLVRHNRLAWVRSVRQLGDKWRLKQYVHRKEAA